MANYLGLIANKINEIAGLVTSAGAADAGKIPALDANGKLDTSLLPTGVGADTQAIVASEALAAGDFVNVYDNASTPNCRKANATDSTKPAHGFVLSAVAAAGTATVYFRGTNNQVAGLTAGTYVLSAATAGGAVPLASGPTATGNIRQILGVATAAGALEVSIDDPITRA